MSDIEKKTKDAIKNGGVLAMLYFDIHAKSKETLQQIGTGFINQVIQKEGVIYGLGEIDEPVGGEEGKNFSSSISLKILTRDFKTLSGLCMSHSPFTVEILRPDEITLTLSQAHELLGLLSATTAEYKRYILTKIAKPEEIERINENMKKRAEMGEKILKGEKNVD